ncbi:5'-3' exonuclease [Streptomyces sp. NPDC054838]
MRPTLLIDGNNILVRAVEATRRSAAMHSPTGIDTSALVVFANTIARHIRTEEPFRVSVLWDAGYAARTALYPPYKATRPTAADPYRGHSRALAREWLHHSGVPQHHLDGVEADDLIASYWRTATSDVVIVSNDKDLLQLVGRTPTGFNCQQLKATGDNRDARWRTEDVINSLGCTPEQLPLAMALAGDTSDNIPGVRSIGMVKAIKHLSAAGWDLDKITHAAIAEQRDNIATYLQLVDLRETHYPVPTISPFMPTRPGPGAHWEALAQFLDHHGLRELTRRLVANELW